MTTFLIVKRFLLLKKYHKIKKSFPSINAETFREIQSLHYNVQQKAKENIPKLKLDLTVIREEDPENNADDINSQSTMRGIMSERTSFEIGFSSRFNNTLNQKVNFRQHNSQKDLPVIHIEPLMPDSQSKIGMQAFQSPFHRKSPFNSTSSLENILKSNVRIKPLRNHEIIDYLTPQLNNKYLKTNGTTSDDDIISENSIHSSTINLYKEALNDQNQIQINLQRNFRSREDTILQTQTDSLNDKQSIQQNKSRSSLLIRDDNENARSSINQSQEIENLELYDVKRHQNIIQSGSRTPRITKPRRYNQAFVNQNQDDENKAYPEKESNESKQQELDQESMNSKDEILASIKGSLHQYNSQSPRFLVRAQPKQRLSQKSQFYYNQ